MFRRIVSHATYSPSLIIEIASYSSRLRRDYKKRLVAFILLAIAFFIQLSILLVSQPSPANTTSNDTVYGGLNNNGNAMIDNFKSAYISNSNLVQTITSYIGISLTDIESSKITSTNVKGLYSWSKTPYDSQNELTLHPIAIDKTPQIFVYTNLVNQSLEVYGLSGTSDVAGKFVIQASTGNFYTEKTPPVATKPMNIKNSIEIANLTHPSSPAQAGDRIKFTLRSSNNGTNKVSYTVYNSVRDLTEYAKLAPDYGGGYFDNANQMLSWSNVEIQPKETISRSFIATIINPIPTNSTSTNNKYSFDCSIKSVYGNEANITVVCPASKSIESIIKSAPTVPIYYSLLLLAILTIGSAFMLAVTALLIKELRIVRQIITQGTI